MTFEQINQRALSSGLALSWYPNAKRFGHSIRTGDIDGNQGMSFWIDLNTGAWKDHATGDSGGDLISLYAARENISQGEAKKRLEDTLGDKMPVKDSIKPVQSRKNTEVFAQEIWKESSASPQTPVEAYLKGRGISHLPPSLRFHPACYHSPTKQKYSAMIAGITRWPDKSPHAVHRTYLEGDEKAKINPNRMILGEVTGGAVRLAPVHSVLALAEGIETALSVQQALGLPSWAVLSASNYRGLVLPDTVKEITIAADNDEAGLKAAHKAAELWSDKGKFVQVIHPPQPNTDFNDLTIASMK